MDEVVCLGSGEEFEMEEDILEVFEEPLEQPEISRLPLYGDTSILEGLVAPEDLGLDDYSSPHISSTSATLPLTKTISQLPHDNTTGKLKRSNNEEPNGLQDCAKSKKDLEKPNEDTISSSQPQYVKKKAKLSTLTSVRHDSRSNNADTEMRISISKRNSGTSGESTQVKIVIPSTSSTSVASAAAAAAASFKADLGSDSSSPSSSSTSAGRKVNEGEKQKPNVKRTARKTMSSFTPRTQAQILAKSRNHDLVTLDSEDEKDSSDHSQELETKKVVEPVCKISTSKIRDSKSASDTKMKRSNTAHNSTAITPKKENRTVEYVEKSLQNSDKSKANDSKTQEGLQFHMELLEDRCTNLLNNVEFLKVKKKFEKRVAVISDHYKNSARLHEFILLKTSNILKEPRKVFPIIKEVLDELTKYGHKDSVPDVVPKKEESGVKKRITLTTISTNEKKTDSHPQPSTSKCAEAPSKEDVRKFGKSGEDAKLTEAQELKRKRHIIKLERALKTCGKEIKRCEEEELDLSDLDDDDSAYLRVSRYKARYMKIYNKVAQLRKLDSSLQRKQDKRFKTEASRIPDINGRIEKLVNKHKLFPDYADILKLYEAHYRENNLVLSRVVIKAEAQDTFVALGRRLKARRKHDELDVLESYVPIEKQDEPDPADQDDELKKVLQESVKQGEDKLTRVVNEFALKQVLSNEQPEEVPDDAGKNDKDDADSEEENEDGETEMEIGDSFGITAPNTNCSADALTDNKSDGLGSKELDTTEEMNTADGSDEDDASTTEDDE